MTHASLSLVRPRRLKSGDRIAAVSPSWGGPGALPQRYEAGKRQMREAFGLELVEMPHTLADPDWVKAHPEARAADLMAAFADPSIAGVFASIGGDDSVRLIPHLDLDVIRAHPKVFLGFSDTTALHFACLKAGLSSFYGPSIMAGFAENGGMHRFTVAALRRALFEPEAMGDVPANTEGWTAERTDWADAAAQAVPRRLLPASPPRTVQGRGVVRGPLIGGCAEVLEMLKGTAWWPDASIWDGAILFYETSEMAPSPDFVRHWMRNYAATGILRRLAGMVIARPDPGSDPDYAARLDAVVVEVLAEEGLTDLPVLSGFDFGHTQPMLTLPYGAMAELDCPATTWRILAPGVD